MKYLLNDIEYEVIITRKANKNTYIRFRNGSIIITTSYFVTDKQLKKILDENHEFLLKNINKMNISKKRDENCIILGEKYDIIIIDNIEEVDFKNKKIYISSKEKIDKLLIKKFYEIFEERLAYNYHLFQEKIPFPTLRIRKMKTRWGVCNRKDIKITLNSELIKYGFEEIDYVIIHELAHLVVFNHSKDFWNVVSKYCKNYKEIRKRLKE